MTNRVFISDAFKREAKPLSKKYHTLKSSIDELIERLKDNPYLGDHYGSGIYKVRLADESKNSGRSGGFRVMYYHLTITNDAIDILLMSIYNKSQKATIKKADALKMLKGILQEHERENP